MEKGRYISGLFRSHIRECWHTSTRAAASKKDGQILAANVIQYDQGTGKIGPGGAAHINAVTKRTARPVNVVSAFDRCAVCFRCRRIRVFLWSDVDLATSRSLSPSERNKHQKYSSAEKYYIFPSQAIKHAHCILHP